MSVRVLVVDDSALVRQVMMEILSHDRALQVVGTAADPYAAWDMIRRLNPDVHWMSKCRAWMVSRFSRS